MSPAATPLAISLDTMLPDLLSHYPQTRTVLDGYGLQGCGGPLGPVESLRFFARAHGVDETRLLREIRAAAAMPASLGVAPSATVSVADSIYRRYFLTGILAILTVGATWGAILLWRIGIRGDFTSVSIHEVNAHGHAQIFGWVGLFIMGFAYQAFPRMWHQPLESPRMAVVNFALMTISTLATSVAMALQGTWPLAWPVVMVAGFVQVFALVFFALQIMLTFQASKARFEPYVGFIFAALLWFIISAGFGLFHAWLTMTTDHPRELLWYVATFQAPLRDVQIHGLALSLILGVSPRMLPGLFDVPRTPDRRAWWALSILTLSVLAEVVLFIAYRFTGNHWLAAWLMVPWLGLAAGIAMVALPWKLWHPLPDSDRSGKFVRAAYLWLAISMVMLLLLPLHQLFTGITFSHAYYGAIRHAITVGFISMMIMGFAAKVVPTLNGLDTRALSPLWGPFVLINVGCFLRVALQSMTDVSESYFMLVGISAVLEVTALAWWGSHLAAIMIRGKRAQAIETARASRPLFILPEHTVADVLNWYPRAEAVFVAHGFGAVRNPLLRHTVAKATSLRRACALRGVDLATFLAAINDAVCQPQSHAAAMDFVRLTIKTS